MSLQDYTNIAVIVAGGMATITFVIHWFQLWHQARSRDFQSYVELLRLIDKAWENYITNSNKDHHRFYFGQLLTVYESACFLSNENITGKRVKDFLDQHLVEIILNMVTDKRTLAEVQEIRSSPDTYAEIIKFSKKHQAKFGSQWEYMEKTGWL